MVERIALIVLLLATNAFVEEAADLLCLLLGPGCPGVLNSERK